MKEENKIDKGYLSEGYYNKVYKEGNRVVKEPQTSAIHDKTQNLMNESKRATRIAKEIYPDLKIEISVMIIRVGLCPFLSMGSQLQMTKNVPKKYLEYIEKTEGEFWMVVD